MSIGTDRAGEETAGPRAKEIQHELPIPRRIVRLPPGYLAIGEPCGEEAGDTFLRRGVGRRGDEKQRVANGNGIASQPKSRWIDPRGQLGLDQPAVESVFPAVIRTHQSL